MFAQNFEDLIIWQDAQKLAYELYRLTSDNKDYGFIDQIRRAALSISNNIAEGFEKDSKNEFRRFLRISKGSCGEVRSMLHLGIKLGYFQNDTYLALIKSLLQLTKQISSFSKKL